MNANQLRTIERVCSTTNLQDIKCEVQVNIHKKRERKKPSWIIKWTRKSTRYHRNFEAPLSYTKSNIDLKKKNREKKL